MLYESFEGNGALCNPEAIFRELLRSPDLADLTHTWVLNSRHAHRAIQEEFAENPMVRFVHYRSVGYFHALATSTFLINNATFPRSSANGQVRFTSIPGMALR
mgnify:CR=1 FL=1